MKTGLAPDVSTSDSTESMLAWSDGLLLRKLRQWQLPLWCVGIGVFLIYYGLPLLLAGVSGTLTSIKTIHPLPLSTGDGTAGILRNFLRGRYTVDGLPYLPYLWDRTHFFFSVVISVGAPIVIWILNTVHVTLLQLVRDGVLIDGSRPVQAHYVKYRSFANSLLLRSLSLALALASGALFYRFYSTPKFVYWWGNMQSGHAGAVFIGIVAMMVYYGTQGILLTTVASAMFTGLFSEPLQLRPFHHDGANGLLPLGQMIMRFWALALLLGAAIWIALFLRYLDLEKTFIAWVLAVIAFASIPAIALTPLIACMGAVRKAKCRLVGPFEKVLDELLRKCENNLQNGDTTVATEPLSELGDLSDVHQFLMAINPWPFNPRGLAIAITIYAVQVITTLRELFN